MQVCKLHQSDSFSNAVIPQDSVLTFMQHTDAGFVLKTKYLKQPVTAVLGRDPQFQTVKQNLALKSQLPTKLSQLQSDSQHLTITTLQKEAWDSKAQGVHTHVISDVTNLQSALDAKASSSDIKNSTVTVKQGDTTKGSFTLNQSTDSVITLDAVPTTLAQLSDDTTHRLVTDSQITTWTGKQDAITSSNKLSYTLLTDTPTIPSLQGYATQLWVTQQGYVTSSGTVAQANKLSTDAGDASQPIYFSSGVPVVCTYKLEKSVPSNAVFTDTTYSSGTGLSLTGTTFSVDSTVTTQGNTFNGTSQLVKTDATGKIPTSVYDNTTYQSKAAASGGTDVSLVTTGQKYIWNSKEAGGSVSTHNSDTAAHPNGFNHTVTVALSTDTNSFYSYRSDLDITVAPSYDQWFAGYLFTDKNAKVINGIQTHRWTDGHIDQLILVGSPDGNHKSITLSVYASANYIVATDWTLNIGSLSVGITGQGEGGQLILSAGSSGEAVYIDCYYGAVRFHGTTCGVHTFSINNSRIYYDGWSYAAYNSDTQVSTDNSTKIATTAFVQTIAATKQSSGVAASTVNTHNSDTAAHPNGFSHNLMVYNSDALIGIKSTDMDPAGSTPAVGKLVFLNKDAGIVSQIHGYSGGSTNEVVTAIASHKKTDPSNYGALYLTYTADDQKIMTSDFEITDCNANTQVSTDNSKKIATTAFVQTIAATKEASGTAATAVSTHNSANDAHSTLFAAKQNTGVASGLVNTHNTTASQHYNGVVKLNEDTYNWEKNILNQRPGTIVKLEGTGYTNSPEGGSDAYCAGTCLSVSVSNAAEDWLRGFYIYGKWNNVLSLWFGVKPNGGSTLNWAKVATESYVTTSVSTHNSAADAHSSLFAAKENTGVAASAVSTHNSAADAHSSLFAAKENTGVAASAVSTHNSDTGAHTNGFNHTLTLSTTSVNGFISTLTNVDVTVTPASDVWGTVTQVGDSSNRAIAAFGYTRKATGTNDAWIAVGDPSTGNGQFMYFNSAKTFGSGWTFQGTVQNDIRPPNYSTGTDISATFNQSYSWTATQNCWIFISTNTYVVAYIDGIQVVGSPLELSYQVLIPIMTGSTLTSNGAIQLIKYATL